VIVLPGTVHNKALEVESQLKRGDKVVIRLGYDEKLETEFEGYLTSISTDANAITLECEDGIYLYRKGLEDREMKNISVKDILTHVNREISASLQQPLSLSCDVELSYPRFIIRNMTGYDVLKKIQREAGSNISMKENTLHVHPPLTQEAEKLTYDFAVNIESADLKYVSEEGVKFQLVYQARGENGEVIEARAGSGGGEREVRSFAGVQTTKSLQELVDSGFKKIVYTGYEGSFNTWLIPFCDAGYQATLKDRDHEYREGSYYVLSVETTFSNAGGVRKITIGEKIES